MRVVLFFCAFVIGSALAIDCTSRPDGAYAWGCRSYIVCSGGVGTQIDCALPQIYNPDIKQCDDPLNVGPPCGLRRDCSGLADGRYADLFTNCTAYYTCVGGLFFGHNPCNPGLVFNEQAQYCDWPYNVAPPCGTKEPTSKKHTLFKNLKKYLKDRTQKQLYHLKAKMPRRHRSL